ncbi:uncharacterized protein METZ01_LOCUS167139 [marine metagenome]|uniref:Uncharacterized protein n=1 Tax=marine metagenome TaxID=408172 RepID=A0A382BKG2_9ZZZZ
MATADSLPIKPIYKDESRAPGLGSHSIQNTCDLSS